MSFRSHIAVLLLACGSVAWTQGPPPPPGPRPGADTNSLPLANLLNPTPFITDGTKQNADYGESIAFADVNGDGYSDLVVGSTGVATFVYLGGPNGLGATPAYVLHGESLNGGEYGRTVTVGDVNGDGYADVIVSDHGYNSGLGPAGDCGRGCRRRLRVFRGVGDANGDGVRDIAGGALGSGSLMQGQVFVYYGKSQ